MTTDSTRVWETAQAAEEWRQNAAWRARTMAVATERMFEAAGLHPGMKVLDVAAGSGDQSVLAAERLGPSGYLLATDISASMLAIADKAARDAGLTNIETRVGDASVIEYPENHFDAAISRNALLYIPNVRQALMRVRHGLKPDARFATVVGAPPERNRWIGIQVDVVREMGRMPAPPPPVVYITTRAERSNLADEFVAAGFRDVQSMYVPTPREFASSDEAIVAAMRGSSSRTGLTSAMSDAEREQYTAELSRRFATYAQPDGRCVIPGDAILCVGTK